MIRSGQLALSGILLYFAFMFPASHIDAVKLQRIDALEKEARELEVTLQAEDDSYVDYINHPYPLSGGRLFQGFLFTDGILLILAAVFLRPKSRNQMAVPASREPVRDVWVICGVTATAAALRFIHAGSDLWLDEITTLIRHARSPVSEIFMQATSSNNHLLNSVLCHISLGLFGESELALRLPAILAGIATIPALYFLIRIYGSREESLLGALLLALSYHHVFFSQDARGYSMLLLGAVGGTYSLVKALKNGLSRYLWMYGLYALICTLSLLFGAVVIAAHALCVAVYLRLARRPAIEWKRAAVLFLSIGYLTAHAYAMIVPDFLGFILGEYRRTEVGWRFSPALLAEILQGLALGRAAVPALAVFGGLGLLGVVSLWRKNSLILALLLAPSIFTVLLVLMSGAAVFPRFFLAALPVAFALLSHGVFAAVGWICRRSKVSHRAVVSVVIVGAIAASVLVLRGLYAHPKQDYTGARSYVERHMRPQDIVIAVGTAGEGYRYYWPGIRLENRISRIRPELQPGKGVWLLYSFPRDMELRRPKLQRMIQTEFREVAYFPGTVNDGGMRVCYFGGL